MGAPQLAFHRLFRAFQPMKIAAAFTLAVLAESKENPKSGSDLPITSNVQVMIAIAVSDTKLDKKCSLSPQRKIIEHEFIQTDGKFMKQSSRMNL
jgi:hypothetical protein